MALKNCPYCGVELFTNEYGDLICPNHGIIVFHERKKEK